MGLEELGLLDARAHGAEALEEPLLHVAAAAQEVGHALHHLLPARHLAQPRVGGRAARRQPPLLEPVHAEAQEVRAALLLAELHVPHLQNHEKN